MINKKKIVFLGAPGTGKGTISQFLKDEYNFIHLSTGDMFRRLIQNHNSLSEKVNAYIQEGKYVPDELTNEVVKESLNLSLSDNPEKLLIFDGYPRTLQQAEYLSTLLTIDIAILLEASDLDEIVNRLSNRLVCPNCQRVFGRKDFADNKEFKLCSYDQSLLISRKDDDINVIKNRIVEYDNSIKDVINFYQQKELLFTVNANLPSSDVKKEVLKLIGINNHGLH